MRHLISQLNRQHIHAHEGIAGAEIHRTNAASGASKRPELLIAQPEMDGHASPRPDQNAVSGDRETHPGEGITLFEIDGDQTIGTDIAEGRQPCALDEATAGKHQQIGVVIEL